eukprot:11365190-Karenia_brevis.AAC.1
MSLCIREWLEKWHFVLPHTFERIRPPTWHPVPFKDGSVLWCISKDATGETSSTGGPHAGGNDLSLIHISEPTRH